MPEVGIVSSIKFRGSILAGFKQGLTDGHLDNANILDDLGYEEGDLNGAIATLNRDVDVIVTAGGLITAQRAVERAAKVFTVIVGDTTDLPALGTHSFYRGGVSLESIARNTDRIMWLHNNKRIELANMCLLANDRSGMRTTEAQAWYGVTGNRQIKYASISRLLPTKTMKTTFDDVFGEITRDYSHVEAVVISADPNFNKNGPDLMNAAKDWLTGSGHLYVAFPLDDYSGHGPDNKMVTHGPVLRDAYKLLGERTSEVVRDSAAAAVVPATEVIIDYP